MLAELFIFNVVHKLSRFPLTLNENDRLLTLFMKMILNPNQYINNRYCLSLLSMRIGFKSLLAERAEKSCDRSEPMIMLKGVNKSKIYARLSHFTTLQMKNAL